MTFKLEINCDNAAFANDDRSESDDKMSAPAQEVARILRQTAEKVENGRIDGGIVDVNGNHVGQYAFKGKQPK